MSSIQLFDFTWQYQPDEEGDQPPANALEIGDPDDVPPLDINIKNILSDKKITLNPIAGVTTASTTNYHFKLAFDPGILNTPEGIAVEGDNWSIFHHSDASADSLYLLWKGEAITINSDRLLPEDKEIILTGVAAKGASEESQFIDLAATTTVVTISWQFKQGDIEVIAVNIPEFKRHSTYKTSLNLTLDMVQTTGKSNIPLFVGFVGSNKVLNVNDGKTNFKLRLTNTNLPNGSSSNITFKYDSDPAKRSQLQIMLEAGDNDWALGTVDEVNDIKVSIEGGQWQQKSKEQVKVGNDVKGYVWTFEPNGSDVVLTPQETMLIDLKNIVTAKPMGGTNLYFYYSYVLGYKDGQFICQIEKAPLVYDGKNVGIGTASTNNLLHVKGNSSGLMALENPQGETDIYYHDNKDSQSWQAGTNRNGWYVYDNDYRLVVNKGGNVGIGIKTPSKKLEVDGTVKANGLEIDGRPIISHETDAFSYYKTTQNPEQTWEVGTNRKVGSDDTKDKNPEGFYIYENESGDYRLVVRKGGNVGIGTKTPTEKLEVDGTIKANSLKANSLTVDGKLEVTGDYYGKGHIWLHAYSGDNKSGTAYIQARDNSKSTDIDLQFRTQKEGEIKPVMRLTKDGNVGIGTDSPSSTLEVDGTVSGIPIVQVKHHRVSSFSTNNNNKQENVTVTLDHPADSAYAVLQGFDLDYDSTDHEIKHLEIRVWANDPSSEKPNEVPVHILVDACDASGHRLEAEHVDFLVIAIGSTTV